MFYNWYYNEKLIKKRSVKKIIFISFLIAIVVPFLLGLNPFVSIDYTNHVFLPLVNFLLENTSLHSYSILFIFVLYLKLLIICFLSFFIFIFFILYLPYRVLFTLKTYNYQLNSYGIIIFTFIKKGNTKEKYLNWIQIKSYKVSKAKNEINLYSGRNILIGRLHINKTTDLEKIKGIFHEFIK